LGGVGKGGEGHTDYKGKWGVRGNISTVWGAGGGKGSTGLKGRNPSNPHSWSRNSVPCRGEKIWGEGGGGGKNALCGVELTAWGE